jgi:hypothetical protein
MIRSSATEAVRGLKTVDLTADLMVVGGGIAGVCAAITAARQGIRVVLVQDRPVLGGNASSEIRLWILGATSHMGNNNRWAREGGVIDEILIENLYRNPEGNPVIVDTILLEKAHGEENITLLLNTAVDEVVKVGADTIETVSAYCSQNQTRYRIQAPLFCDASGDGILAFLSGAAFRVGAESKDEFNEPLAPDEGYGELLGHSLYFYSRDTGLPVRFIPPAFALPDITQIPRYRAIRPSDSGCRLWWLEWGGRLDTVYDTEQIKWELWKVAYGVWNHIKNSGQFPEAETLTLEWVGAIPGKRESRRFEGDYMLTQLDIVGQQRHADPVSFGGWAIDLHPADGVYSELSPCTQWHSKGIYQIPYRCLYSRNIRNLFLAGRIISVSHVAFGSTRVMATCGNNAQVVGMAAALCRERGLLPRDLTEGTRMNALQMRLLRTGQYIPGIALYDDADIARQATVSASSQFILDTLKPDGDTVPLDASRAVLLPVPAGVAPAVKFLVDVSQPAELTVQVRSSSVHGNYTPDVVLRSETLQLEPGKEQAIWVSPGEVEVAACYLTYCLLENPSVRVRTSDVRVTGLLSLSQSQNAAVAKGSKQQPPPNTGIDEFEFWLPSRRPGGKNLAIQLEPAVALFEARNVLNGVARPTNQPNAWVTAADDARPRLTLQWSEPRRVGRVEIGFDTDFDHPMESVLMGHPEREVPFCVKRYRILDEHCNPVFESAHNHQTRSTAILPPDFATSALHIEVIETRGVPAAIFEVRCYEV